MEDSSSITTIRVYDSNSHSTSLLPPTSRASRAEQRELREELLRAKKRTEALSSKLSETQRDLKYIRSNMEARVGGQPTQQHALWFPSRPTTGYQQVGGVEDFGTQPPPTGVQYNYRQ